MKKFYSRIGVALPLASLWPAAAHAECLSDGCYDGLVWALLGFAVVALVILAVGVFVAFKLGKRFGWLVALGFLAVLGVIGWTFVSGFL